MRRSPVVFLAPLLAACLSGCRKDEIHSYRVAKVARDADQPAASRQQRELRWTLPRGWTEEPPSQMRLASFSAPGKEGLRADISVVVLDGDAGGDLANVNRWRGQIDLPPISQAELPKFSRKIPAGGGMLLVDFVTPGLFIDNRYKKRLIAAICARGGRSWFFKMTGEDALLRSLKPSFLSFLDSVRFNEDSGA